MAITKRQQELDALKWAKSEELGYDACGSFDFCVKCDKALENPCDNAYKKFHAKPKKAAAPAAEKKPAAKKSCKKAAPAKVEEVVAKVEEKPAVKAEEKAPAKKPAAKKAPAKK